jgi:hypothetical protein
VELRECGETSSGGRGPEEIQQKVSEDEWRQVINGEGFLALRRNSMRCKQARLSQRA